MHIRKFIRVGHPFTLASYLWFDNSNDYTSPFSAYFRMLKKCILPNVESHKLLCFLQLEEAGCWSRTADIANKISFLKVHASEAFLSDSFSNLLVFYFSDC